MRTAIRATPQHFHDLAGHFLALGSRDRFLRFGWAITDAQIVAYVESLLGSTDTVLVVPEPLRGFSGVLHLESMGCGLTLGLSVSARFRGLGVGTLLLQRAQLLAGARGVTTLFVRNLSINAELQRLALHLGMRVACAPPAEGAPLEALPPNGGDAITLADDALRSQWNGALAGAGLPDVTELMFS